jgi:hypothetical protein
VNEQADDDCAEEAKDSQCRAAAFSGLVVEQLLLTPAPAMRANAGRAQEQADGLPE